MEIKINSLCPHSLAGGGEIFEPDQINYFGKYLASHYFQNNSYLIKQNGGELNDNTIVGVIIPKGVFKSVNITNNEDSSYITNSNIFTGCYDTDNVYNTINYFTRPTSKIYSITKIYSDNTCFNEYYSFGSTFNDKDDAIYRYTTPVLIITIVEVNDGDGNLTIGDISSRKIKLDNIAYIPITYKDLKDNFQDFITAHSDEIFRN